MDEIKQEKPTFEHPQPQSNEPAYGQVYSDLPPPGVINPDITDLQNRVRDIENKRLNLNTDIIGLFETVSVAPTKTPISPWGQVKIYVNGATYRLYWYDANANVWHYVTATA